MPSYTADRLEQSAAAAERQAVKEFKGQALQITCRLALVHLFSA